MGGNRYDGGWDFSSVWSWVLVGWGGVSWVEFCGGFANYCDRVAMSILVRPVVRH